MEPISASDAFSRSRGEKKNSPDGTDADDINFTLTIARLFETIRQESEKGVKKIAFIAPRFIMDGCLADPIILAKQMKVRLLTLGYAVEREGDTLFVSWDKTDTEKRERIIGLIRTKKSNEQPKVASLANIPRGYAKKKK